MKKFRLLLFVGVVLIALFVLMGCDEACMHTSCAVTSAGNGEHTVACDACGYAVTEKCIGGTANCQTGPICTKCNAEYGEADPNAHCWNPTTGECDTEGCTVICEHIDHTAVISIGNAQHKITCSLCTHEATRACTGGTATCQKGKICESCDAEYTAADINAHAWNAATGECDVPGCDAVCAHNYVVSDNRIDDALHTGTCSICHYVTAESCTGGFATCTARALCERCGAAYGELVPIGANYQYVVIIGVDGAGTFFKNADTPSIDQIFANGAITYDMITSNPTYGAQAWGSLLHGVTPEFHQLTDVNVGSAYPTDSPYPSFFRVIRENDPNAVLASFSHWAPINVGIVESDLNVHKVGGMSDEQIKNEILTYLAFASPTAMLVQFGEADETGQKNGYNTPAQHQTITRIDGYVGEIYDAYEKKGIINETLFIVTATHGGFGKSHGGWSDAEKYVMLAAAGKTVKNGGAVQDAEIRDTAAIVIHALGYGDRQSKTWTARVPGDLFVGVAASERPVYVNTESGRYHETVPTPTKGSGQHVTDFVDKSLSVYLPFDGNIADQCNNATTSNGALAFTEKGYYGGAVRLNDGYVTLSDYALKNESFTLAFWIRTQGSGTDPCIVSNANWRDGTNSGFSLALRKTSLIRFNMGIDQRDRRVADASLPSDFGEGWMHVSVAVDRENNEVRISYDFKAPVVVSLKIDNIDFQGILNGLNIGQDGTGNYAALPAMLDEFMIFEGAFTSDDIADLAEYYGMTNI